MCFINFKRPRASVLITWILPNNEIIKYYYLKYSIIYHFSFSFEIINVIYMCACSCMCACACVCAYVCVCVRTRVFGLECVETKHIPYRTNAIFHKMEATSKWQLFRTNDIIIHFPEILKFVVKLNVKCDILKHNKRLFYVCNIYEPEQY